MGKLIIPVHLPLRAVYFTQGRGVGKRGNPLVSSPLPFGGFPVPVRPASSPQR